MSGRVSDHWPYARELADRMSQRKRLTDAELAAEFEASRCDFLVSQSTGHYWAPLGETWPNSNEAAGRRTAALLRFATLALASDKLDFTVNDARAELRGKNLACWCPLGQPCHADVLLEVVNR